MSPRAALALLAAAALALAAPAGAQQTSPCPVRASVNPAAQEHRPGETLAYAFTVVNEGLVAADVAVNVSQATPGWNASLDRDRFTLAGGAEQTVTVQVTAPTGEGPRQASVTVAADVQCAAPPPVGGSFRSSTSQVLSPSLAPPAAPVTPPGGGPGLGLLAVAGLVVLVAAVGGAVLLARPKGLVVRAPEPRRDVPPGGGASFAVQVQNRSRQQVQAGVKVVGLPEGWRVVAPPAEVTLAPGASQTIQVLLRSPASAEPGDAAEAEVQLLERGTDKLRSVALQAFVVGPGGEGERPDVVVRDEAGLEETR